MTENYRCEYAKSGISKCKGCYFNIEKETFRLAELIQSNSYDGKNENWYHFDCFFKRFTLSSPFQIAGFLSIKFEDQQNIEKLISKDKCLPPLTKEKKSLKKQSNLIFKFVDELKKLKRKELFQLYKHNRIEVPQYKDKTEEINFIADALAFGVTTACPECGARLKFEDIKYKCSGYKPTYEPCQYATQEPERRELIIPEALHKYTFLKEYKYVQGKRIFDINYLNMVKQKETQKLAAWNEDIKNWDCKIEGNIKSGLEDKAHILHEGSNFYRANLKYVDITHDKNSFYNLQLLEDNSTNSEYWVFRSWGRIGTTNSDKMLTKFENKMEAIVEFKKLFLEKTKNEWDNRSKFARKFDMYYPVGDGENAFPVIESTSTLPESVNTSFIE